MKNSNHIKLLFTLPSTLLAAEEAGLSRIYGGIHFNFDNTAGLELGRKVGTAVLTRSLVRVL